MVCSISKLLVRHLFCLGLLITPAQASDRVVGEAVEALEAYAVYKMAQYELAFERFYSLAERGNVQGMLNVANMLQAGLGVDKDPVGALRWYEAAAKRGDATGMYYLGQAYERGTGTEVDLNHAGKWFRSASMAGMSDGSLALGRLRLRQGDETAGLKWIRKAADAGNRAAIDYLSFLTLSANESSQEARSTSVSSLDQAAVHAAFQAIDRAARSKNAAGVVYYLHHDAEVRIRLPQTPTWTSLEKKELKRWWQKTFDQSSDYDFVRGPLSTRMGVGPGDAPLPHNATAASAPYVALEINSNMF